MAIWVVNSSAQLQHKEIHGCLVRDSISNSPPVLLSYVDMTTVDRTKVTAESYKYDVKRGYSISQY